MTARKARRRAPAPPPVAVADRPAPPPVLQTTGPVSDVPAYVTQLEHGIVARETRIAELATSEAAHAAVAERARRRLAALRSKRRARVDAVAYVALFVVATASVARAALEVLDGSAWAFAWLAPAVACWVAARWLATRGAQDGGGRG